MFTGIVTACGTLARTKQDGNRLALTIEASLAGLELGDSVAVNGACLTVIAAGDGWFQVEVVVTTRERTRFAEMSEGERVNLERAVAVGDRLGGHLVQGHVDGVGEVLRVGHQDDALLLDLAVPEDVAGITIPHGSIAVDGVSLTVNHIPEPGVVQVSLIPHTRAHTTLGEVVEGRHVHIEGDVIGKYVRQLLDGTEAYGTLWRADGPRHDRTSD